MTSRRQHANTAVAEWDDATVALADGDYVAYVPESVTLQALVDDDFDWGYADWKMEQEFRQAEQEYEDTMARLADDGCPHYVDPWLLPMGAAKDELQCGCSHDAGWHTSPAGACFHSGCGCSRFEVML